MPDRIAIVGAGLIGRAWCICFARSGREVALYDPVPDAATNARRWIEHSLVDLARHELLAGRAPQDVLAHIRIARSLDEALEGANHVQECAPESLPVKRDLYIELDAVAHAEAVLCSSTSALLPSAFTAEIPGRHRCLVGHPINPPHLVPAVEIVPAPWTAPAVVERARALMAAIGQAPVVLSREIDGFLVNRLQGALLQEAFRLVAGGYAGVRDIDAAISKGLGLRWAFMGPFETIDLNAPLGLVDYVARFEGMYRTIAEKQQHPVPWAGALAARIETERAQALPRDRLGERQSWRDRRLMALVADLRAAEKELGA
jgi:3-hydroxyacyl-CoA dehydrogenase